jgi:Putative Ig domain
MKSRIFLVVSVLGALAAAHAQTTTPPVLTSLNPTSAAAGGAAFTLTLTGSNFQPNSLVLWNAIPVTSTFLSATQLSANIPANLIATPGLAVVQVQNPDGTRSTPQPFSITQAPPTITTDTLTAAVSGTPYTAALAATGGSPPYIWSVVGGSFPAGLVLNPSGIITGTPTTTGSFSFTVRVVDSVQGSAQKNLQLTVNAPPFLISTSVLPPATVGVAYSQVLAASNGVPPYRWSLNLPPPGLTLDPATGILSGTPTTNGNFTFTAQVGDSTGQSASKSLTLLVNPAPLVITTTSVFTATVGLTYSQTFAATGGIPPYRWTLSGTLGSGLTFDAGTASITGTPQAVGSFPFTVQVADSAGVVTSKSYTLSVQQPSLNILTASPLPSGVAGTAYPQQRFSAVGGTPPYTWSISAGSVQGLALDPAGNFSGTPATAGTYTFTVTVRDSIALTTSKTFTLVINPSLLTITSARDLTPGVVGTALTQRLQASGGAPPYTWSANGLPDGLLLDPATGILSGTPKAPGTFSFTIRVSDTALATSLDLFRIVINFPTLPNLTLTGFPATSAPAIQPKIQLTLASPLSTDLTGQLTLSFVPESGGGDTAIQFSTGGRTVAFTIAANSTTASFPVEELALQTGTVAGAINISAQLQASGVDVTPSPAPVFTTRVERAAPVITRVSFTRTASALTVQVTGYSTAREVSQAVFQFSAVSGNTLQTPQVTVPADSLFNPWFQDPASSRFGSQFLFTQQFTVQGDANALTLESVTLTNRLGSTTGKP